MVGDRHNDIARGKVPLIKKSIAHHPGLQTYLNEFKDKPELPLYGTNLDHLIQLAKPGYKHCQDILKFWEVTKIWRNQLFHRLLGLEKSDVFSAWGTSTQKEWESRVLGCLNFLPRLDFTKKRELLTVNKIKTLVGGICPLIK